MNKGQKKRYHVKDFPVGSCVRGVYMGTYAYTGKVIDVNGRSRIIVVQYADDARWWIDLDHNKNTIEKIS